MKTNLIWSLFLLALIAGCQAGMGCENEYPVYLPGMERPYQSEWVSTEYEPVAQPVYNPRVEDQIGNTGKIYFLSLSEVEGETYMALDEISVFEGNAPDYRSGGSWYFQLIDSHQRVLEEGYFERSKMVCGDRGCHESNTPLILKIPYHRNGADITVYDQDGIVRFGPYDVRDM